MASDGETSEGKRKRESAEVDGEEGERASHGEKKEKSHKEHKSHKDKRHKKEKKEKKEHKEKSHRRSKSAEPNEGGDAAEAPKKDQQTPPEANGAAEAVEAAEQDVTMDNRKESPEPGELPEKANTLEKERDRHSPRRDRRRRDRDRGRERDHSRHRSRDRDRGRDRHSSRDRGRDRRDRDRERDLERRERHRHTSRERGRELPPPPPPSYRDREAARRVRDRGPGRGHSPVRCRSRSGERRGRDRPRSRDHEESPPPDTPKEPQDEDALIEARRNRWKQIKERHIEDDTALDADKSTDKDTTKPDEEMDEEALIEMRRQRLKAIKEKYSQGQAAAATPPQPAAGEANDAPGTNDPPDATDNGQGAKDDEEEDVAGHDEDSAEDVVLAKPDEEQDSARSAEAKPDGHASGSEEAAQRGSALQSGLKPGDKDAKQKSPEGGGGGGDMFASDDEEAGDIFAKTPETKGGKLAIGAGADKGLLDNWDDADGYYKFKVGEIMNDRFHVAATLGRGVFSSVLRAQDTQRIKSDGSYESVAIKVIRANDVMYKAGQLEREILNLLAKEDMDGKRHNIRLLEHFEYRSHLCLVFESMSMNLRELVKKYGRDVGLNINAVRQYAEQLMIGLHHMHRCKVIHADIKPDNILVNDRNTIVKFCDFGSAMYSGENDVTPYLVSRFYRSPEIILGLQYDQPLDMWSVGCVLYELSTGKILFPGRTNNEMLKLMMTFQGPFPKKMLRKGAFTFNHFDGEQLDDFCLLEEDPVTRMPIRRNIKTSKIRTKTFHEVLGKSGGDKKRTAALADLLEKCLALDPEKRITPKQALTHPFICSPKEAAGSKAK